MFAHDYQENLTNIVEIKDFKFEVFEELLKFIYSGKVDDLDKHAADLFRAAEKVMFLIYFTICKKFNNLFFKFQYDLETLKRLSVKSFSDQLSLQNFTEILEDIPSLYKNDDLLDTVSNFLAANAAELRDEHMEDLAKFIEKYTEYSNDVLLNWIEKPIDDDLDSTQELNESDISTTIMSDSDSSLELLA
jgi:hypothetical protein